MDANGTRPDDTDFPVVTITEGCPDCGANLAAVDEAHELAAESADRAAMWQGVGLGALGMAALIVGAVVMWARLRGVIAQGDEHDEGA